MACREIRLCSDGEMDFRRDQGRGNLVDCRLEIKMQRQYRISSG